MSIKFSAIDWRFIPKVNSPANLEDDLGGVHFVGFGQITGHAIKGCPKRVE